MKKTKTIFAGILAILLAGALLLGFAGCDFLFAEDMTDDDVATLSAAVANTRSYDGSYTFTDDIKESYTSDFTIKETYKYSYDKENSIEYTYDEMSITISSETIKSASETYIASDEMSGNYYPRYHIDDGEKTKGSVSPSYCFYSLSNTISNNSSVSLSSYSNISTTGELESVISKLASSYGYDGNKTDDTDMELKVSGSKYTSSVSFSGGEVSVAITVKDGRVTKIKQSIETDSGISFSESVEISYRYKSSLAYKFSDLSQWD